MQSNSNKTRSQRQASQVQVDQDDSRKPRTTRAAAASPLREQNPNKQSKDLQEQDWHNPDSHYTKLQVKRIIGSGSFGKHCSAHINRNIFPL